MRGFSLGWQFTHSEWRSHILHVILTITACVRGSSFALTLMWPSHTSNSTLGWSATSQGVLNCALHCCDASSPLSLLCNVNNATPLYYFSLPSPTFHQVHVNPFSQASQIVIKWPSPSFGTYTLAPSSTPSLGQPILNCLAPRLPPSTLAAV